LPLHKNGQAPSGLSFHWPLPSQLCGTSPLQRPSPGAHTPPQLPLTASQMYMHAVGVPQVESVWHSCVLEPEHWWVPGVQLPPH